MRWRVGDGRGAWDDSERVERESGGSKGHRALQGQRQAATVPRKKQDDRPLARVQAEAFGHEERGASRMGQLPCADLQPAPAPVDQ
jgi:hypothetical protein